MNVGHVGIWSRELRTGDPRDSAGAAAELDRLGYGAIWMPGRAGSDFWQLAGGMLDATDSIVVASGILSVWTNPVPDVAAARAALATRHPGRFLLGLGVSHAAAVEAQTGLRYEHPVAVVTQYLDDLEAAGQPVPRSELVLAALGPRMLGLARDRSAGAHPYFVPVEHTLLAREVLGSGVLLAPEQAVVLEADPMTARAIARRHTTSYLAAPNYANNLRRLGWTDEDFADGGSDRLVDALVAWGDLAAVRRRIVEHLDAGADHVCLQVLPAHADTIPLREWRVLAEVVKL